MYYRLVDSRLEPYATWYNDTDLKELAFGIFSLWDTDDMREEYWDTDEKRVQKIYKMLKQWVRDFIYIVQEQEEPFPEEENPSNH